MYVQYICTGRTLACHIVHYASFYWYFVAIITGLGKKSIVFSWPPLYLCTAKIMNQRPGTRLCGWDPGITNDPTSSRNLASGLWRYNWPFILKQCRCSSIASPLIAFRYSCLAWPWAFKLYTILWNFGWKGVGGMGCCSYVPTIMWQHGHGHCYVTHRSEASVVSGYVG